MHRVKTHFLPELLDPESMPGQVAVVIDVLRASTTVVHALHNGADSVIPFVDIADATKAAEDLNSKNGQGSALLAGERGGLRVEGFDLGNSPTEYSTERVAGRKICFTTTNGTKALDRCRAAAAILIGTFVNRAAVADRIRQWADINLVCAGTNGKITYEDVLGAGAIIWGLLKTGQPLELDDSSQIASAAWSDVGISADPAQRETAAETEDDLHARFVQVLGRQLELSYGGRNLKRIGQDSDLAIASELDSCTEVPQFQAATGEIRLLS